MLSVLPTTLSIPTCGHVRLVDLPDYSSFEVVDGNWGAQHGDCSEAVPLDAPVPKGNPVLLTTFVDANLMADATTGRSRTGIIHLRLN